jgi:hypothetical protein
MRDPRIPEVGVKTPMRIKEDAGMCSEVLAKRIAVDVTVVKPLRYSINEESMP